MRRLAALLLILLVSLPLAGCQGWDVGPAWIGDGSRDPEQDTATSDSGFGRDISRWFSRPPRSQ